MISPIAFAAVQKFDAIFALERAVNGLSPDQRLAMRRRDIAPLVNEFIAWMKQERAKLSRHNDVANAKAFDYMLKRINAFTRFLGDGRICLSNNAAERALRGIAIIRSFCPCRAGNRSSLPVASVFWVHGPHSPCGATGDRSILEGPRSGRCCCFHGCVDARPGDVRRNDHGSAAS